MKKFILFIKKRFFADIEGNLQAMSASLYSIFFKNVDINKTSIWYKIKNTSVLM